MNETKSNTLLIEEYIKFVSDNIEKFKSIGNLIRGSEVPTDKVYRALANYYNVCLMLQTEYQRSKIEKIHLEIEYEAKYADWFQEAKHTLYVANEEKKTKPALKEIEQQIIVSHKEEYFSWKRKIVKVEAQCEFFIRLREILNKYDSILVSLASSMRAELRALSIEERAENTSKQFGGYPNSTELASFPKRGQSDS